MIGHWPSGVGVFVKSLHLLVLGWLGTIALVWFAINQNQPGAVPNMVIPALIPALTIEALALGTDQWTRSLSRPWHTHAHEWQQAFWWSLVPNLLLLGTAWLMIKELK